MSRFEKLEGELLPEDLVYDDVAGLTREAREKLALARPRSVGQASRLHGVTPAAVSALLVHLRRRAG